MGYPGSDFQAWSQSGVTDHSGQHPYHQVCVAPSPSHPISWNVSSWEESFAQVWLRLGKCLSGQGRGTQESWGWPFSLPWAFLFICCWYLLCANSLSTQAGEGATLEKENLPS